jgi:hypothetical protein
MTEDRRILKMSVKSSDSATFVAMGGIGSFFFAVLRVSAFVAVSGTEEEETLGLDKAFGIAFIAASSVAVDAGAFGAPFLDTSSCLVGRVLHSKRCFQQQVLLASGAFLQREPWRVVAVQRGGDVPFLLDQKSLKGFERQGVQ